jgi:cell division protein FtsI/penicillin-binding protein 2
MLNSRVSRQRPRAAVSGPGAKKPTTARRSPRPDRSMRPRSAVQSTAGTARPIALLAIMVLAAGGIIARLAFWQVMQHGHLSAMATSQRDEILKRPPLRGGIMDRNGNPLAADITLDQVYAIPKEMKEPRQVAALLAPVIGQSQQHLEKVFSDYRGYVLIAPQVPTPVSVQLKHLRLPGIVLHPEVRRYYPEASTASQILGFANADNQGNYGLEGKYDNVLSGKAGIGSVLRDTAGNDIRFSSAPPSPTRNGATLQLSIDGAVQSLVEHELQKAVQAHRAAGGTIIVMDPRTGFILGMTSTPSFDPNRYWQETDPSRFRNPSVEWTYEPGSTFKIITMAAGLDSHAITPESALYDGGVFKIADATIHNWNGGGFGYENMTQVLQHSANVGAAWVAQHMTTDQFYSYVKKFGVGSPTHIDLADEQNGQLPLPTSKQWTIVNKYTNAYGQGLAVTPIQLIRAVASVANGGILMKPQVVQRMTYDGRVIEHPPVAQGRVISAATARTLTDMLVHSAMGGEAERGLVKGYDVAAKTGTANVPGPGGRYIDNATIASVVGYAPAYNPKFIALVILDRPKDTLYGSIAAAPVLHNLLQELFLYYHIPPSPHALNR